MVREDFLPSWSLHLLLPTSESVFVSRLSKTCALVVRFPHRRGSSPSQAFEYAASHALVSDPVTCGLLFTELLNYIYFLAFPPQYLLLFLLEHALQLISCFSLGTISFLLARMLLALLFSHSFNCDFFDLILNWLIAYIDLSEGIFNALFILFIVSQLIGLKVVVLLGFIHSRSYIKICSTIEFLFPLVSLHSKPFFEEILRLSTDF